MEVPGAVTGRRQSAMVPCHRKTGPGEELTESEYARNGGGMTSALTHPPTHSSTKQS